MLLSHGSTISLCAVLRCAVPAEAVFGDFGITDYQMKKTINWLVIIGFYLFYNFNFCIKKSALCSDLFISKKTPLR